MLTLFQDANDDEQLLTVEEFADHCNQSRNDSLRIFSTYIPDHCVNAPTRIIIFYDGSRPEQTEKST